MSECHISYFFDKLYEGASSNQECLERLIKARGFLLDKNGGEIYVSNNSYLKERDEIKIDVEYLDEILKKYNLGMVEDNHIIINNTQNYRLMEEEFSENKNRIPREMIHYYYEETWKYFKTRKHGYKAGVCLLEPFIARYVKAASACGVIIYGSCDGNHNNQDYAFLQISGKPSIIWHQLIWENCLSNRYDIEWKDDYTSFNFNGEKYKNYYLINMAAKFLYENRLEIRKIKEMALLKIGLHTLKNSDTGYITNAFVSQAQKLFSESQLQSKL